MNVRRSLVALLTAVATLTLTGSAYAASPQAHVTAPPAAKYVAMGDSFASGLGAGDYAPGTDGGCYRSARSYPEALVAGAHALGRSVDFINATCSGATIQSVRSSQLGAVTPDTALVTLSIGANDVQAMQYGWTCLTEECAGPATDAIMQQMPVLKSNVHALLSDIARQAPNALIVLTGYGQILTTNPVSSSGDPVCPQVSPTERQAVGDVMARLDASLSEATLAAQQGGVKAIYASPYQQPGILRSSFQGHSLCDGGQAEPWYHGWRPGDEPAGLLHPKVPWQAAMVDAIVSQAEGS